MSDKTRPESRQAETQAELEQARQQRLERQEATLRRRFLSAGGSEEQWLRERESILARARADATLSGDELTRRANQRRYS